MQKILTMARQGLACLALMALAVPLVHAEVEDDIEQGFKRIDPAQEQRLRQVLAQPVPSNASPNQLRRYFLDKDAAAAQLFDDAQRIVVLRQATSALPDAVFKNNLARELLKKGEIQEGNEWMRQAMAAASPSVGILYAASAGCDLLNQNRLTESRKLMAEVQVRALDVLSNVSNDVARLTIARGQARAELCLSQLETRQGKVQPAIAAAEKAEQHIRKAQSLLRPQSNSRTYVYATTAQIMARLLQAYRLAGRLQEAELTLAEYIRLSREVELPPSYLSGIYATAGNLRFSQREFVAAEQLLRKSDNVLEKLGWDALTSARSNRVQSLLTALIGQKKWQVADQELKRLDTLAGNDTQRKNRVQFRFERALVYFGNQRFAEAAPLFERQAQGLKSIYEDSHFFIAQATGMQGAALWRSGSADNRAKALPLLSAAVRDYMAPFNADYSENLGIRKEIRDMVFAAYLEAVSTTSGQDPTQAMGPADWVRSSVVQDALADAAVRSALNTPALASVVRQEQDAKNEIAALRSYLSGDAGAASSPLPDVARQMRERIAQLQGQRSQLQSQIKSQFPDYDRLVRPAPPNVQTIAQQLDATQAMLMLLPTQDAVYVWAVASDRPARFVRAALTDKDITQLVVRIREHLDLGTMSRAPKQYDSEAAFELYSKLLAPVEAAWKGKSQLIIAAGGALSQLPFAVLHTASGAGYDAKAPWLIAQAAITQVPSLSAWSAIKTIAKSRSASEAFAGWGDPVFSAQSAAASSQARNVNIQRGSRLVDLEAAVDTRSSAPSALRYSDMPQLPDTRDELQAMAKILSADMQRDVLLGQRATRDSVLAASSSGMLARKRVIAFATHGLMAGDLPQLNQPALALTAVAGSADPLAPLLTLEDVLTLKLNADWVVLSACNTAAADGRAEEALSGLARGFFYAGSRSLLVTHWSVESASATLLTTATFEHYTKNPQAPKAESLRQAMLQVMAKPQYTHPAFWAPYALVGDGGR